MQNGGNGFLMWMRGKTHSDGPLVGPLDLSAWSNNLQAIVGNAEGIDDSLLTTRGSQKEVSNGVSPIKCIGLASFWHLPQLLVHGGKRLQDQSHLRRLQGKKTKGRQITQLNLETAGHAVWRSNRAASTFDWESQALCRRQRSPLAPRLGGASFHPAAPGKALQSAWRGVRCPSGCLKCLGPARVGFCWAVEYAALAN